MLTVEGAADETFINPPSRTQEGKGDDCKPKPPVEDLFGLAQVFEFKNVDWPLNPASHCFCCADVGELKEGVVTWN